jgi:hypothetical protein
MRAFLGVVLRVRRGAGRSVAARMRRARRGGRLVLHFFFPLLRFVVPVESILLIVCTFLCLPSD